MAVNENVKIRLECILQRVESSCSMRCCFCIKMLLLQITLSACASRDMSRFVVQARVVEVSE